MNKNCVTCAVLQPDQPGHQRVTGGGSSHTLSTLILVLPLPKWMREPCLLRERERSRPIETGQSRQCVLCSSEFDAVLMSEATVESVEVSFSMLEEEDKKDHLVRLPLSLEHHHREEVVHLRVTLTDQSWPGQALGNSAERRNILLLSNHHSGSQ